MYVPKKTVTRCLSSFLSSHDRHPFLSRQTSFLSFFFLDSSQSTIHYTSLCFYKNFMTISSSRFLDITLRKEVVCRLLGNHLNSLQVFKKSSFFMKKQLLETDKKVPLCLSHKLLPKDWSAKAMVNRQKLRQLIETSPLYFFLKASLLFSSEQSSLLFEWKSMTWHNSMTVILDL